MDIKTLPAMRLATVRHTGPYAQIAPAFHALGAIAGPAGLFAAPGALMVALYKDDPATTPEVALQSAAGVVVGEDAAIPNGLFEDRVIEGRFACHTHVGSYAKLPDAWAKAKNAILTADHRARPAVAYEIYRNNPAEVAEADLCTEICIPIE